MSKPENAAWSDFWARESAGAQGGGCLPQGWATIEAAQKRAWHDVIRNSRKGARVLDLATGDGRVLRWLRAARPDLKLFGVDAAPALPAAPKGCKVRAGVRMEQLPFADGAFDFVTSQFGFEYGEVERVAGEAARVLVPGGTLALMVHRGDGPILAHNLKRRNGISWALEERKVLEIARGALAFPAASNFALQRLAAVAAEGARLFGRASPAWEITEAARQTLTLGLQRDPASIGATLAVLRERAGNEIARIDSLERACAMADDRRNLLRALAAAGLRERGTTVVAEPSKEAFADLIVLTKSAQIEMK